MGPSTNFESEEIHLREQIHLSLDSSRCLQYRTTLEQQILDLTTAQESYHNCDTSTWSRSTIYIAGKSMCLYPYGDHRTMSNYGPWNFIQPYRTRPYLTEEKESRTSDHGRVCIIIPFCKEQSQRKTIVILRLLPTKNIYSIPCHKNRCRIMDPGILSIIALQDQILAY